MRSTVVALVLCALGAAAQENAVFRATTELVLLDVEVRHKKTNTVAPSVDRAHLRVWEDGKPQEVAFLSRDQLPLSVILLFDLTDSVRPVLKQLAKGARTALAHFKPEDQIAVMDYASTARLLEGFTKDRERTAEAIDRAAEDRWDEAAFFNESVFQAAAELKRSSNPSSRRVIVWLTDNLPNVPAEHIRASKGASVPPGALHTEEDAFQALHTEGVVVAPLLLRSRWALPFYSLVMATEAPWRKGNPPGDAHKYAELTGASSTELRGKDAERRLADLIDELRSRYTIGYRPAETKPAGTFCKVKVELDAKGPLRPREWLVRTRSGYYRK